MTTAKAKAKAKPSAKVVFDFTGTPILEKIFVTIPEELVGEAYVDDFDNVCGFRIDRKLKFRKSSGIVAIPGDEDNKDFVPPSHYSFGPEEVCLYGDLCVTVELPNPAVELELYQKVREKMLAELKKRLEKVFKKLEGKV